MIIIIEIHALMYILDLESTNFIIDFHLHLVYYLNVYNYGIEFQCEVAAIATTIYEVRLLSLFNLAQRWQPTPTSLLEKEAIPFHTSPLRDGDAMFH